MCVLIAPMKHWQYDFQEDVCQPEHRENEWKILWADIYFYNTHQDFTLDTEKEGSSISLLSSETKEKTMQ